MNTLKIITVFLVIPLVYHPVIKAQSWYDLAEHRIDSIRKGNFAFNIVDALDQPVNDSISIKLIKHEFEWGNLVTHPGYDTDDFEWTQAALLKYFNAGNVERFKWNYMEPTPGTVNYSEVDTILSWIQKAGWYVRGHTLLWGGANSWQLPPWIVADTMSLSGLNDACETRVRREVTRYQNIFDEYDVINEPIHETWLAQRTGDSINWNSFVWARESDPKAKLYVNEYNIIVWPIVDQYVDTIQKMIDHGAPIDGIGVQGHMENDINWEQIKSSLDQLSVFDLPIKVTEFDMKIDENNISEQNQANYYAQMMRTTFSYPLIQGFYFFGLYDKYMWRHGSGIYTENKIPKIAEDTVYHLIHEKWSTKLSDSSDASGHYEFRGFYGDYEIAVRTGDSVVIFNESYTHEFEDSVYVLKINESSPPHPEFLGAQTNEDGSKVELHFNMSMNDPSGSYSKFCVYNISKNRVTSAVLKEGDSTVIVLTLTEPLIYRQYAVVVYTFGDITSHRDGTLLNFGPEEIENSLPGFKQAYTNEDGTIISVFFSESMSSTIPADAFTIEVNGVEAVTSAPVIGLADETMIQFTLDQPIASSSDMIFISYIPGIFESLDGFLLGAFGPKLVQNNVPPLIPSSLSSGEENTIRVYPNPADDELFLEHKDEIEKIIIYSYDGKSIIVLTHPIFKDGYSIDVSAFGPGIYVIQCIDVKGNIFTNKFVIE